MAIVDASGNLVVEYKYDAWGSPISISGSLKTTLGELNPFRYRGYVYDEETGLYYLRSRYYNSERGRFINADAVLGKVGALDTHNLFAYCGNNPVIHSDSYGDRYCAATTVSKESAYDRVISCNFQKRVSLEKAGKVRDITAKLNAFMEENASKLTGYLYVCGYERACKYFYDNVKDGGELDIKLTDEWKFEEGVTYIYSGQELRYDDPGNINFGYVGHVLFDRTVLCLGAGGNQIMKYGFKFGDVFSFFDDPRDNRMIKWGYRLYEEKHK